MTATESSTPLRQQLDYYRARAAEYDQWWLRQARYDRGAALNAQWFADAAVVSSALSAFRPAGRVLEFACGTGIWSEQLLPFASHLTALDGSPEMLAIIAARLRSCTSDKYPRLLIPEIISVTILTGFDQSAQVEQTTWRPKLAAAFEPALAL